MGCPVLRGLVRCPGLNGYSRGTLDGAARRRLRPAAARDRLVTRFWVRKDAALQAVGCGLSLAPERIEAGFHGDHGTVRVPGFHGAEVLFSGRNFAFSAAYECAVAVPESLALTPSFSYSAG
ncbi:hypothetical protein [Streptomyces tubercidicus]|uniref:hypothetical protein n=1 Tax=Streptomyces tubercidicus TaxID=47759 RepID=UPI001356B389|nr:hypothetical protein [Streptomyces tubercidicus]WAU13205.1 hypothetical protein STRTU_003662 [Streptomyces tubercidicus]